MDAQEGSSFVSEIEGIHSCKSNLIVCGLEWGCVVPITQSAMGNPEIIYYPATI